MENWDGNQRSDGFAVHELSDGTWIVTAPDKTIQIATCPCCDLPFRQSRAAKMIADRVYPMRLPC